MVRTFKYHQSEDYDLQRVQDNTRDAFKSFLNDIEILNGRHIQNIELIQNGSKVIKHGLDRTLRGWILTRLNKNANIWDTQADSNTLTLTTGANGVTVSIWVF